MKKENMIVKDFIKKQTMIVHIYAEEIIPSIRTDLLYGRMLGISKVCYHFLEMQENSNSLKLQLQLLDIEELRKMAKEYGYENISLQFMGSKPHESYVEIYHGKGCIELKKLKDMLEEEKNKKPYKESYSEFFFPRELKEETGPFYKKFIKR